MTSDAKTLAFYDQNSEEYAAFAAHQPRLGNIQKFIADLPEKARVVDLGCGTGWAAALMKKAGMRVDAMDASSGLAKQANELHGLEVQVKVFTELSGQQRYDGLWSHFALQHAPRSQREEIFARITSVLKPGGLFYAGMQKGDTDWRDGHGRLYCPFVEDDLEALLSGFADIRLEQGSGKNFDGTPTENLYVWARTHS